MKLVLVLIVVFGLLIAGSLIFLFKYEKVDTSVCDAIVDINPDKKLPCYFDLIHTAKSYSLCEKLKDFFISHPPEGATPFQWQGIVNSNDELCKLNVLVNSKNKDDKECEKFSRELKGDCYWNVAIESERPELCVKELVSGECLGEIAIKKNDVSICFEADKYRSKEDICPGCLGDMGENGGIYDSVETSCLHRYVLKTTDVRVCDAISSNDGWCYKLLANLLNDESYCDKISDEENASRILKLKDACYGDVAVLKKDKSLCEKLPAPTSARTSFLPGITMSTDPWNFRKKCIDAVDKGRSFHYE